MNLPGDSLSGQNNGRRADGAGSSPVLPTPSQRTKLWNQMRKADKDHQEEEDYLNRILFFKNSDQIQESRITLQRIDDKRMDIRLKLKGYK